MSELQQAIEEMRTMRESYDELAAEITTNKAAIVSAINIMGGDSTTNETLSQLGEDITQLRAIISPEPVFTNNVPTPINPVDYYLQSMPYIEEVNSSTATSVKANAFQNSSVIKKVNLPNVTSVGNYSFSNCPNLEEILLPKVVSIGQEGMSCNTKLKKISLPEMTGVLSGSIFRGCTNLIECYLPKQKKLTNLMFSACTSLTILYVPNISVATENRQETFNGASSLIDLTIGAEFNTSMTFSGILYSPSVAYNAASSSLCFSTDIDTYGRVFSNNNEKWNWCLREHFAANLPDRTGMTAYTITFGATVLGKMEADTIAAFTNKNWTLA